MIDDNMVDLGGESEDIEVIKKLTIDNNIMLHKIERRAKLGIYFKIMYWIVIFGIAAGAFYYVQPYIDDLMKVYENLKHTQEKSSEFIKGFNFDSIKEYFAE